MNASTMKLWTPGRIAWVALVVTVKIALSLTVVDWLLRPAFPGCSYWWALAVWLVLDLMHSGAERWLDAATQAPSRSEQQAAAPPPS